MSILLEQWNVLVWLCGLSWRSVVRRNARQTTLGRGGKESGGNGVWVGEWFVTQKIDFSGVAVRATIGVEMDGKGKREGGGVM